MWFLVAAADAEGLPWECPVVATPAEAQPFDDDAGVDELISELASAVQVWWEEDCPWVVTTVDAYTTEQSCVTSAGAQVTLRLYDETYTSYMNDYTYWQDRLLTVVPPPDAETWRAATTEIYTFYFSQTTYESSLTKRSVAWSGACADHPVDGWLSAESSYESLDMTTEEAYATPGCAWSWGSALFFPGLDDWRVMDGRRYEVFSGLLQCDTYLVQAYVDGALFGHVDTAWALDEQDSDGWSVADGDCDDTDPGIHPCAVGIALDGVDQDCDGVDETDGDGDGYDAVVAGGEDCEDLDGWVHPGADDPCGDGIDQDCDGHDDVDADGDRYTADGDIDPADCDDTDPGVHPGEAELAYDGVDQDCDGADLDDLDADGWLDADDCNDLNPDVYPGAPEVRCEVDEDCDGVACEEPELGGGGCGCGGASQSALLAGLLLLRWGASRRGARLLGPGGQT